MIGGGKRIVVGDICMIVRGEIDCPLCVCDVSLHLIADMRFKISALQYATYSLGAYFLYF